ncbi:MAG TPA: YraN family protein [bacterium]
MRDATETPADAGDGRRALGASGEALAARYLERRGYRVIDRNVRCGRGEIDLVAVDRATIVFVEVKSNRSPRFGAPEEMVTAAKQRQLTRLALQYLQHRRWLGRPARFDVVAIAWDPGGAAAIRHFRDAFPAAGW